MSTPLEDLKQRNLQVKQRNRQRLQQKRQLELEISKIKFESELDAKILALIEDIQHLERDECKGENFMVVAQRQQTDKKPFDISKTIPEELRNICIFLQGFVSITLHGYKPYDNKCSIDHMEGPEKDLSFEMNGETIKIPFDEYSDDLDFTNLTTKEMEVQDELDDEVHGWTILSFLIAVY
jgi:hypothetical protein